MLRTRSLSVVLALALAPIACKGGEADGGAKSEPAPAAAPAQQEVEKAPEPAQPEPAVKPEGEAGSESDTGEEEPPVALPESFEKIGIAECDDYVAAHVACIEKMPEAEREAARRSVFDNLEAWKQTAAGGPAAEKGLTTGCRIAREQAKRATQTLGCQW